MTNQADEREAIALAKRGWALKQKFNLPIEVMGWINEAATALRAPASEAVREASEIWTYIERLLVDECGLRTDEGLEGQRSNCINAIQNGMPDSGVLNAAIEFLSSGQGLHKIRVHGRRMDRTAVAAALALPQSASGAGEAPRPHNYSPDHQAQGDCRICGWSQDQPWHEAGPAPQAKEPAADRETIETLLALLNPLHGDLDKQTYDAKVSMDFDMPSDYAHDVTVTSQQERDLTQAVLILENRLRDGQVARPATPYTVRKARAGAKAYVDQAIASYAGDPADNQFQKGFLAALEVVRDEAFSTDHRTIRPTAIWPDIASVPSRGEP